jgi:antitoxin CptB
VSERADRARLKWRCRRGTRELDVLLERFLEAGGLDGAAPQLAALQRLLELPDPVLVDCLILGRRAPNGLEEIVERVRADARARAE